MLNKLTTNTKCDVRDCKNDAAVCFETKGRSKCFLCAQCMAQLASDCRILTVPKSPQNAIKKKQDRRVQDE